MFTMSLTMHCNRGSASSRVDPFSDSFDVLPVMIYYLAWFGVGIEPCTSSKLVCIEVTSAAQGGSAAPTAPASALA